MRNRLIGIGLAATLGGCTMIPDYMRPALPTSATYPGGPAGAGAAAADIGWKDFFTDPATQQLIALSLENNRDLRVAVGNVEVAQAQYRIQRANLLPTIDGTAGAEFAREPAGLTGSSVPVHINAYSLGASAMSYELDLFGGIRSTARQYQEEYLSSAETRESTQISLVAQVAAEYLAWLADRQGLKISQDTRDAQQKSFDLVQMEVRGGTATALDLAQAETTLRTAQASVQQYTRQVAQDMDELVLLVGAPLPADLQMRMMAAPSLSALPDFPSVPPGLPSDLLQRRPDIRAAEHTLLAANANIGAARAAFFPSITLTASGGTGSGRLANLFGAGTGSWLFEPNISVPIFDAGKNFANLDVAKTEKRIEVANYEKAIQSAFHDVTDALAARDTYKLQTQAQTKLVSADQRYFDLSSMRFRNGIDNYLNVLVAQNSLFAAQLSLVSLQLSQLQSEITLYKALGGGWTDHGPGQLASACDASQSSAPTPAARPVARLACSR